MPDKLYIKFIPDVDGGIFLAVAVALDGFVEYVKSSPTLEDAARGERKADDTDTYNYL